VDLALAVAGVKRMNLGGSMNDAIRPEHRRRRSSRDDRLERLIITEHSAAVLFEKLAHRDADGRLVDAGLLHVTGDAIEPRATVAGETAPRGPGLATDVDDVRDGRDRLEVVDDRRHAEGALDRRKGRLEARLAALALERLQQR